MKRAVLVVDDEPQVRFVIRAKLEQRDFVVHEAANGEEAVALLDREAVDVLVTDILMPERDGLETILHVREAHPEVGIVAISAASNDVYLRCARAFGAARVVTKPLRLGELARVVEELARR